MTSHLAIEQAKMSERVERSVLLLDTVLKEMDVKQMEGTLYHREIAYLGMVTRGLVKMKRALLERGQ